MADDPSLNPSAPDDNQLAQELENTQPDEQDYVENEDGSMTMKDMDGLSHTEVEEFYGNLLDQIPQEQVRSIAYKYFDLIEKDKDARRKRDEHYAEGLARTGMAGEKDSPGGAQFEGSSRVVHPIIAETCVDFSASAIKEIFPSNGPVRTKIEGRADAGKIAKAERKRDFLNWQLTTQIEEYEDELEQEYTQLPLGGSQYMKWWWNAALKRPSCEFVPIDDIYLPYAASGLYSAERVTQVHKITEMEFRDRIESGMYADPERIVSPSQITEESAAQRVTDKIEGKQYGGYNEDGLREIYEVFCYLNFDGDPENKDGKSLPYVLCLDESSSDILAIRRNWEHDDPLKKKMDWIVESKFIPWRGAYGIGIYHLIGSLAIALTGSLRALLDSAHINNAAAMLKLKSRVNGQNQQVNIGGVTEIDAGAGVDDIRKVAMPMPFNPPSTVLFQLLGWLENAAKGVVTTAEEKIKDASNNMPMGTALALIEQGSKVYRSIHKRLHKSQKKTLQILARINRMYLEPDTVIKELGELTIQPEDFKEIDDIIPVSDPSIFSESQRFAQMQAVDQMATAKPQFFKQREVVKRQLQQLRIPAYEELLVPEQDMLKANPIAENIAMTKGRPAIAFPDQDHLDHIKNHLEFLNNPMLGSSRILMQKFYPLCLDHVQEHIVYFYAKDAYEKATAANKGVEISEFTKDDALSTRVDKLLSLAATEAIVDMNTQLKDILQDIAAAFQKMQQVAQQQQSSAPPDPAMANVQRQAQADQANAQIAQAKIQVDQQQLALDQQKLQAETGVKAQQTQIQMQRVQNEIQAENQILAQAVQKDQADNATKLTINEQDNATAMKIAAAEMANGHRAGVSTGTGLKPSVE